MKNFKLGDKISACGIYMGKIYEIDYMPGDKDIKGMHFARLLISGQESCLLDDGYLINDKSNVKYYVDND